jgi:SnoaL-like domain
MPIQQDSPAVAVARAHVEAWSNHDFDAARDCLADGVKVDVTSTNGTMPETRSTGIDDYMKGLIEFGQAVVPSSAHVIASVGDERNALLMVTVKAAFGTGAPELTLSAARLYLLAEDSKIEAERVIFFAAPA